MKKIYKQRYTGDYYEHKELLNHSLICIFKDNPIKFWDMTHNLREAPAPNDRMKYGKALHMYFLQPMEFKKKYFVGQFSDKPQSKQQEKMAKLIVAGYDPEKAYNECYAKPDKADFEKKMKFLNPYIESLKDADGREMISKESMETILLTEKNFFQHMGVQNIWKPGWELSKPDSDCYAINELEVRWTHYTGMKCKSMIDRVTVDEKSKRISIIELKTSMDEPAIFAHNVEFNPRNTYAQQLCFYSMCLDTEFRDYIVENRFEFDYYIIYMDSTWGYVYLLQLSENLVRGIGGTRVLELDDRIKDINVFKLRHHNPNMKLQDGVDYKLGQELNI